MNDRLKELYERGATGLDCSPGDPLCYWAHGEILRLRAALQPFAHFMDIWEQQMKGGNTAKTGAIYTVENRAGVAEITVEALREARKVLQP